MREIELGVTRQGWPIVLRDDGYAREWGGKGAAAYMQAGGWPPFEALTVFNAAERSISLDGPGAHRYTLYVRFHSYGSGVDGAYASAQLRLNSSLFGNDWASEVYVSSPTYDGVSAEEYMREAYAALCQVLETYL